MVVAATVLEHDLGASGDGDLLGRERVVEGVDVFGHAVDQFGDFLAEDLGDTGDRTSLATIPADKTARAAFIARSPGVIAGLPAAEMV